MALGDITETVAGESCSVEILASAIAANGIPSGTSGIDLSLVRRSIGRIPASIRVGVRSTAGSGTMTVTLRVWGRAGGVWFRLKDLNAASTAPHTAVAIPETGADSIQFSENVEGVGGCDRLYLEILAIAGTSTAVTGYAIVGR
jgi:hypothetical protein